MNAVHVSGRSGQGRGRLGRITAALLAGLVLAALPLVGCGGSSSSSGSSESTYKKEFSAQKQQFQQLGRDMVTALRSAPGQSDATLAVRFAGLSSRATSTADAIRKLKPPSKFQSANSQLASAFDAVAGDLKAVSAAATQHSASAAQNASRSLVQHAAQVKQVDRQITGQLGLPQSG